MLTNEQLKEIAARTEAATPGPWIADIAECAKIRDENGELISMFSYLDSKKGRRNSDEVAANARFSAHARTDIPALLSHIEHQRRAMEWQSKRMVKHARGNMHICMEKQCRNDSGCAECLVQAALNATKEAANV